MTARDPREGWSEYDGVPMARMVVEFHSVVAKSKDGSWQWWINMCRCIGDKVELSSGFGCASQEDARKEVEIYFDRLIAMSEETS